MKTLNQLKNRYRKAKKGFTKEKILNASMLLSQEEQNKFIAWQIAWENKI